MKLPGASTTGRKKRVDIELCEASVVPNLSERSSWKLNNSAGRCPSILRNSQRLFDGW